MDIIGRAKNKLICLLVTNLIIVRMNKKNIENLWIWLVINDEIKSKKEGKIVINLLKRSNYILYFSVNKIYYRLIYTFVQMLIIIFL